MKTGNNARRTASLVAIMVAAIIVLATAAACHSEARAEPPDLVLPELAACLAKMHDRGEPNADTALTICAAHPEIAASMMRAPDVEDYRDCFLRANKNFRDHYPHTKMRGIYDFQVRYGAAVCSGAVPTTALERTPAER